MNANYKSYSEQMNEKMNNLYKNLLEKGSKEPLKNDQQQIHYDNTLHKKEHNNDYTKSITDRQVQFITQFALAKEIKENVGQSLNECQKKEQTADNSIQNTTLQQISKLSILSKKISNDATTSIDKIDKDHDYTSYKYVQNKDLLSEESKTKERYLRVAAFGSDIDGITENNIYIDSYKGNGDNLYAIKQWADDTNEYCCKLVKSMDVSSDHSVYKNFVQSQESPEVKKRIEAELQEKYDALKQNQELYNKHISDLINHMKEMNQSSKVSYLKRYDHDPQNTYNSNIIKSKNIGEKSNPTKNNEERDKIKKEQERRREDQYYEDFLYELSEKSSDRSFFTQAKYQYRNFYNKNKHKYLSHKLEQTVGQTSYDNTINSGNDVAEGKDIFMEMAKAGYAGLAVSGKISEKSSKGKGIADGTLKSSTIRDTMKKSGISQNDINHLEYIFRKPVLSKSDYAKVAYTIDRHMKQKYNVNLEKMTYRSRKSFIRSLDANESKMVDQFFAIKKVNKYRNESKNNSRNLKQALKGVMLHDVRKTDMYRGMNVYAKSIRLGATGLSISIKAGQVAIKPATKIVKKASKAGAGFVAKNTGRYMRLHHANIYNRYRSARIKSKTARFNRRKNIDNVKDKISFLINHTPFKVFKATYYKFRQSKVGQILSIPFRVAAAPFKVISKVGKFLRVIRRAALICAGGLILFGVLCTCIVTVSVNGLESFIPFTSKITDSLAGGAVVDLIAKNEKFYDDIEGTAAELTDVNIKIGSDPADYNRETGTCKEKYGTKINKDYLTYYSYTGDKAFQAIKKGKDPALEDGAVQLDAGWLNFKSIISMANIRMFDASNNHKTTDKVRAAYEYYCESLFDKTHNYNIIPSSKLFLCADGCRTSKYSCIWKDGNKKVSEAVLNYEGKKYSDICDGDKKDSKGYHGCLLYYCNDPREDENSLGPFSKKWYGKKSDKSLDVDGYMTTSNNAKEAITDHGCESKTKDVTYYCANSIGINNNNEYDRKKNVLLEFAKNQHKVNEYNETKLTTSGEDFVQALCDKSGFCESVQSVADTVVTDSGLTLDINNKTGTRKFENKIYNIHLIKDIKHVSNKYFQAVKGKLKGNTAIYVLSTGDPISGFTLSKYWFLPCPGHNMQLEYKYCPGHAGCTGHELEYCPGHIGADVKIGVLTAPGDDGSDYSDKKVASEKQKQKIDYSDLQIFKVDDLGWKAVKDGETLDITKEDKNSTKKLKNAAKWMYDKSNDYPIAYKNDLAKWAGWKDKRTGKNNMELVTIMIMQDWKSWFKKDMQKEYQSLIDDTIAANANGTNKLTNSQNEKVNKALYDLSKESFNNDETIRDKVKAAIQYAIQQVGCQYDQSRRMNKNPNIFDCSSLVFRAYASAGWGVGAAVNASWAPTAAIECQTLQNAGCEVKGGIDFALPGDLIFFKNDRSNPNKVSHVAMYVGNGCIVHASSPTVGVVYKKMSEQYKGSIYWIGRPALAHMK